MQIIRICIYWAESENSPPVHREISAPGGALGLECRNLQVEREVFRWAMAEARMSL